MTEFFGDDIGSECRFISLSEVSVIKSVRVVSGKCAHDLFTVAIGGFFCRTKHETFS